MTQCIFSGNIAGLSHSRPNLAELQAEESLILLKEPHNEYDPNAIAIRHLIAGKLGYIPKEATICLHEAWANGFDPTAKIVSVLSGRQDKVIIEVRINI